MSFDDKNIKPHGSYLMSLCPVIPVVTFTHLDQAAPVANILFEAGISIIEVTLRTETAYAAIASIAGSVPQMAVGAGTVLDQTQMQQALQCGAQFVLSPGINHELLQASQNLQLAYMPGVMTPSEIMQGYAAGYRHFKFFPASLPGAVDFLKAVQGPFPDIQFCPTGGITAQNCAHYLSLPNVRCVGMSSLVDKNLLESRDWKALKRQVSKVYQTVQRESS